MKTASHDPTVGISIFALTLSCAIILPTYPAAAVTLNNASFESIKAGFSNPTDGNWQELQVNDATQDLISSWTLFHESTGDFYGQVNPGTSGNVVMSGGNASAGTYALMLKSPASVQTRVAMYQAVGTILPGGTYTFTLDVGSNASTSNVFAASQRSALVLTTNPTVALAEGPEQHVNLQLGAYTDNLQTGLAAGVWATRSVTLTPTSIANFNLAGQTLYALIWHKGNTAKEMLLFDNARITESIEAAAAPEPSTSGLMLLALAGVIALAVRSRGVRRASVANQL